MAGWVRGREVEGGGGGRGKLINFPAVETSKSTVQTSSNYPVQNGSDRRFHRPRRLGRLRPGRLHRGRLRRGRLYPGRHRRLGPTAPVPINRIGATDSHRLTLIERYRVILHREFPPLLLLLLFSSSDFFFGRAKREESRFPFA